MSKKIILNSILNYETSFKGYLLRVYDNKEEFKKDVISSLNESEKFLTDIISYYKNDLVSRNDTNSTMEQCKCLSDLILTLEGYQCYLNKYDI
ncbi:hypothetical protein [Clostridium sporogenes]|uniref:hypothetical protein n=1 Tax=Clostridium sporogenes TaxID=1509 RepID=UPI0013CF711A|nr:hypothetical protein [Clostridium sporogenes]NFH40730.1 hypothetical protein [Clostridium sporogenes]